MIASLLLVFYLVLLVILLSELLISNSIFLFSQLKLYLLLQLQDDRKLSGFEHRIPRVTSAVNLKMFQLHALVMLNVGGYVDLPSSNWFGDFRTNITIHVIDSIRPRNLSSLFGVGENGDRIIVWDDGEADRLMNEKKSWEALEVWRF